MDSQLLQYVTGFGLATQAGKKATIPVFLLGAFHYTPYFKLSDSFAWIASPPVMIILGALIVVEKYLDAHPDLGEHMDIVSYLPATAAGFICLASETGSVDANITSLATSGILGSATGMGAHYWRNRYRKPIRENLEDLDDTIGKGVTLSETATTAVMSVMFIIWPLLAVGVLIVAGLCAWFIVRRINSRRTPCAHCGKPMRPHAHICPHCRTERRS